MARLFGWLTATLAALAAAAAALVAAGLYGYSRLTSEQEAARVILRQLGPEHYELTLALPRAEARRFELRGDEWQIDARVLKLRGLAVVAGFDTVYRLDRVSGRYSDIARERSEPRTVHGIAEDTPVDFWALVRRYHERLPFADALYGSAAYVPMADGAQYVVSVSASGLVVRPQGEAAKRAVSEWR